MPSIKRRWPILAALLVTVCSGVGGGANCSSSQKAKEPVTVTDKDNGAKIRVEKGATLIVKLESRPGTGYSWRVVKNDPNKLMPEGEPATIGPDKDVLDGVEYQVFQFKAVSRGVVKLELDYFRVWEKDTPPAKRFSIEANIT